MLGLNQVERCFVSERHVDLMPEARNPHDSVARTAVQAAALKVRVRHQLAGKSLHQCFVGWSVHDFIMPKIPSTSDAAGRDAVALVFA
jgi:hypothetical protein